jgi:hypothetical protein
LAAELQHLGHEGERLEFCPLVERCQDLGLTAHLDDLANTQVKHVARRNLF